MSLAKDNILPLAMLGVGGAIGLYYLFGRGADGNTDCPIGYHKDANGFCVSDDPETVFITPPEMPAGKSIINLGYYIKPTFGAVGTSTYVKGYHFEKWFYVKPDPVESAPYIDPTKYTQIRFRFRSNYPGSDDFDYDQSVSVPQDGRPFMICYRNVSSSGNPARSFPFPTAYDDWIVEVRLRDNSTDGTHLLDRAIDSAGITFLKYDTTYLMPKVEPFTRQTWRSDWIIEDPLNTVSQYLVPTAQKTLYYIDEPVVP